jgi:protocatechuate 3,4-dioxygenase beta subunit
VDEQLNRSDIRSDPSSGVARAGALLALTFNVSRAASGACSPLAGAIVDVWHCDAAGLYSDVEANGTVGQEFLRGYQVTDAGGVARFTTIYPGWYQGRAVHIHFKVRSAASAGSAYEFTSQLFFPERFLSAIYTERGPYTARGDDGRLRNANDGIYGQGGSRLLLEPVPRGAGYAATFNIGLQTDG